MGKNQLCWFEMRVCRSELARDSVLPVVTDTDCANAIASKADHRPVHSCKSVSAADLARLVEAFGQVQVFKFYVVGSAIGKEGDFLLGQGADLFRRAADIQKPALQHLARRHQAASTDDHLVLNHGAVHDRAAHADQDAIAKGAAVQHDFMADGHLVTDQQREALGVERSGVGDMQHAAVLHTGARPNADTVHVAADHGQGPDRAVVTYFDIAEHDGRMIDKGAFAKCWGVVLEGAEGHDRFLLWH